MYIAKSVPKVKNDYLGSKVVFYYDMTDKSAVLSVMTCQIVSGFFVRMSEKLVVIWIVGEGRLKFSHRGSFFNQLNCYKRLSDELESKRGSLS